MPDKFDKFTERTRKVFTYAQEEAQRFNHNYIGTEHLLLGLVREGDGIAARVLANLGVQLPKVRSAVEFIIGRGDGLVVGDPGLTPRAKKVIELAMDEARRLNNHYIGTEHLLLGVVREGEGIAAGVLESLGVSLEKVRASVLQTMGQPAEVIGARSRGAQTVTTQLLLRILGLSPRDVARLDSLAREQNRPIEDLIRDAIHRVWLTEREEPKPDDANES